MEADVETDFVYMFKSEDEIKEEPISYADLEHVSHSKEEASQTAEVSMSKEPGDDSEEELPLPSEVVIDEEQFSEDEASVINSRTLSVSWEGATKVNEKPPTVQCPFCNKPVHVLYFSNHLPHCEEWKIQNIKKERGTDTPSSGITMGKQKTLKDGECDDVNPQMDLEDSDGEFIFFKSKDEEVEDTSDGSSDEDDIDDCENTGMEKGENDIKLVDDIDWHDIDWSRLRHFPFSGHERYNYNLKYPVNSCDLKPWQVFNIFFDDEILNLIVTETNKCAKQYLEDSNVSCKVHMARWKDASPDEIRKFFGIIMYMGLVAYPSIDDYWSTGMLYKNNFVPRAMSRNRFLLLLHCLRFADNISNNTGDRMSRFHNIVELLQTKFCKEYLPGEVLTVEETMVPFARDIPGKCHKHGVKIFKVCNSIGYTLQIMMHFGRVHAVGEKLAKDVVLNLIKDYLNEGRTVVTDKSYTSVPLAKCLLQHQTHLIGTLQNFNRTHLPGIVQSRLGEGGVVGKVTSEGIVVGKWRDKRDVLFLTTKHGLEKVPSGEKGSTGAEKLKPSVIVDCNSIKRGVDVSDSTSSFYAPLWKSVQWYHRVVFEVLLNTAVVNALILYQKLTQRTILIKNFREEIVTNLLQLEETREPMKTEPRQARILPSHSLILSQARDERNRKIRKRCHECCVKVQESDGRVKAQKKVKRVDTLCKRCNKWLCTTCYFETH